ncbi:MAG: radical SAM protein [Elusimicrobia bacterium]|nr:radical SAM protein [Elusimicrobiota bacterium]
MADEVKSVEINLGHLCNNRCAFCMSGRDRDLKGPWAEAERVVAELELFRKQGCDSVGFLGGEPTAYPRLEECVRAARRLGYRRVAICSNGTRLADAAFCRRLAQAGLTRATLSVHSRRAQIEDERITKVPGNLARKIAAVENLAGLRREGLLPDGLALNPVLCRPNLEDMEGYVAFFSRKGVRDIRFNYIWPEGEAKGDPAWVPRLSEAAPRLARLILLNEARWGLHLSFGGVPRCVLGLSGLSPRLARGLAGKYLDEGARDEPNAVSLPERGAAALERFIWQENKRDRLKAKGPRCGSCRHFSACEGVWRTYAELYGFDELAPME